MKAIDLGIFTALKGKGLCLFLGVHPGYFWEMKQKGSEEFQYMVQCIEDVVYEQKFTGAATGLLHERIIICELGLRAKKQISAPQTITVSYFSAEEEYVD